MLMRILWVVLVRCLTSVRITLRGFCPRLPFLSDFCNSNDKRRSTPAMMLTHFLIFEKGNSKLRKKGYKVVGFKVKRFMEVMNISAARPSKRKADFLSALREVGIINGIMPAIADLNKITPAKLEKTVLRITVKSEIKELDSHIKNILLGAKM